MGNSKFIGCLHLGHKSIAQRRGFHDEWYHDDYLIEQWNSVVHKKDIVYILGDITMETPEPYYKLDLLKGIKRVILGNHDRPKDVPELLKYVDTVSGVTYYKGFLLTHCPIHPSEIGFCRANIHAHIHTNILHEVELPDRYAQYEERDFPTLHKYINVDAHKLDFKPRTLEELYEGR